MTSGTGCLFSWVLRYYLAVSGKPSNGHHLGYCFDYAALSAEVSAAGFVDVRRYEAGKGDDPVFRGLERRHEPTEAATELIVEARKGPAEPHQSSAG